MFYVCPFNSQILTLENAGDYTTAMSPNETKFQLIMLKDVALKFCV